MDYDLSPSPVVSLDSATSGSSWGDFFTGAGGLLQSYSQYRVAKSTNAMKADGQVAPTVAGQPVPAWLLPVAVIGGLGLAAYLILRK